MAARALLALGLLVPSGAAGPGPVACHLGGCAADLEAGGGGALSLLQAEGAKAALGIRHRPPSQPRPPQRGGSGAVNAEGAPDRGGAMAEVEPFATLLQVHSQALEAAKRLASGSRVRNAFDLFIVLPVLGFLATIFAIAATVVVEQRAMSIAQRCDGAPMGGSRGASPRAGGDLVMSPGNIYKGLRSLLHGEAPPPGAPARSRARAPGAEALLPGTPAAPWGGSSSPSFGEPWGQVAMPESRPGTMGQQAGELKSQGSAVETITVMRPMEDGRLGLKLTDDTLEITDFSDLRAQEFGFRKGDRILQVNGVNVAQRDDFVEEMAKALELNRLQGVPMAFLVIRQLRAGPPQTAAPAWATRAQLAAPVQPTAPPPAAEAKATLAMPPPSLPQGRVAAVSGDSTEDSHMLASSRSVLAKSAPMLGPWVYSDDTGEYNYQIMREASGLLLRFSQQLPSGNIVSGSLSEVEEGWHQGILSAESGMRHGTIRLRFDTQTGEMVSLLKMQGDSNFGEEVRSHRLEAPASLSPRVPDKAAPALPFASAATSPASLQGYDRFDPSALPQTQ